MPNSTDTLTLDLNGTDPKSTLHDYLDLFDAAHIDVSSISVEIEAEGGISLPSALLAAGTTEDSPADESHGAIQSATTDGGTVADPPSPAPVGPDYSPDDPAPEPASDDDTTPDVDDDPDAQDSTTKRTGEIQTKSGGSESTPRSDDDRTPDAEFERGGLARLDRTGGVDDLREGVEYWGEIDGTQNYGLFVNVSEGGDVTGLLHRSKFPDSASVSDYNEGDEIVVVLDEVTERGPAFSFPSTETDTDGDSNTDSDTDRNTDSNTDTYTDTYTDSDTSAMSSSGAGADDGERGLAALGLTKVDDEDAEDDDDDDGDDREPITVPRSEVDTERPSDEQIEKLLRPGERRYQTVAVLARADDWMETPEMAERVAGTPWEMSAKSLSGRLLDAVRDGLAARRPVDGKNAYEYALIEDVEEAVADAEDRAADADGAFTFADAVIA